MEGWGRRRSGQANGKLEEAQRREAKNVKTLSKLGAKRAAAQEADDSALLAQIDQLEGIERKEAAAIQEELEAARGASASHAASAEWLRDKRLEWLPRFEAPRRDQLTGLFCLEVMSAAPAPCTQRAAASG